MGLPSDAASRAAAPTSCGGGTNQNDAVAVVRIVADAVAQELTQAAGKPGARPARYIVIDRHHLAYLNAIEKLNCVYCGYTNGVFAYVREVAARTEQYWCPIKHARRLMGAHGRYAGFGDFGDGEHYREALEASRRALREDSGD